MDVTEEEKQKIREKIQKLKESKFKQQTLPAWRPVPTAMSTLVTFSIFSVVFIGMGIVLLTYSNSIMEASKQYDSGIGAEGCPQVSFKKGADNTCVKTFEIKEDFPGNVFFYYQLDNFYQNHRRYVKSRDNGQLAGQYSVATKLTNCDPITKVSDLWENQKFNLNKPAVKLADDLPAIPCGLVAKSLFNDTYILKKCKDDACTQFDPIDIDSNNIAWASDKTYKFKNIEKDLPAGKKWQDVQWQDMTSEHFIVWMRTAGLPNFRKLWGRIDPGKITKGKYQITIQNNYEVTAFQGKKSFVLSTTNTFGGKNFFLAYCYIAVGAICLVFAIIFLCVYLKRGNSNAPIEHN